MSKVQNTDAAAYIRRIRRYRYEMSKCASANVSFVSTADYERAMKYLDSLDSLLAFFQGEPVLDCPEYHGGREIELGERPAIIHIENESINDMIALYDMLEIEVANCQSARLASKFIEPDAKRIKDLVQKQRSFMQSYVKDTLPLDLPESSPMRQGVGPGRTGLNPS